MNKQLSAFQNIWVPKINNFLSSEVIKYSDQNELGKSMAYSVDAGGKRLRPLMTLAVLDTLKIDITDELLKTALAVELVHTYSLIHDDLPSMDNDDLRRGKDTNHVVFGESIATLAGDGLQAMAFQWLVENTLSKNIQVNLVYSLAKAAGPLGMVAGQADDVFNENHQLTLEKLKKLHQHKTGDLIHYSVEAGVLIGQGDQYETELLDFADSFGLAFQIYDDILDATSNEHELGKPVQQDENKNTYVNLLGLDGAKNKLSEAIESGQKSLQKISDKIDTSLLDSFFTYFKLVNGD